jgi:hypothetical protein
MAYQIDPVKDGDILISGFQNGIGASPYTGLTDLSSVDPVSVPGEATVSLATQSVTQAPNVGSQTVTVSSVSGTFPIAESLLLETFQAVTITSAGSSGLTANGIYWLVYISNSGGNNYYGFSPAYGSLSTQNITTTGPVTFSSINPATPKYFAKSSVTNFMVDSSGLVWSDTFVTSGAGSVVATNSWTYTGNPTDSTSNGNGLLVYKTIHNGTGSSGFPATFDEWLFVWRNAQIDYTQLSSNDSVVSISWVVGWNPSLTTTPTTGHTNYLQSSYLINNSHMAITTLPNMAVYCDSFYVSIFFQNIPSLATLSYIGFDPTNPTTYYFNTFNLLPPTDVAQCLSFLNQYVLIGGAQNYIYPWNAANLDKEYTAPIIILPESNVVNIVNVGNNGYVFCGNRGNIYITNGSQSSLFQKVPDHLSGTIEPYFYWGGAAYTKNRIYFGLYADNPNSNSIPVPYNGLWCIDLETRAIFKSNKLSYSGTNPIHASAIMIPTTNSSGANSYAGYGLLIGFSDGSGVFGIDRTIGTPYTGGQSWVASDLIPIGTAIDPTTPSQIEFKLSQPLVSGESVQIYVGTYLDMTYGSFSVCNFNGQTSFNTVGAISGITDGMPKWQNQWIIVKAILTSTATSPSYVRLTELRIKGATLRLTSFFGSTQ